MILLNLYIVDVKIIKIYLLRSIYKCLVMLLLTDNDTAKQSEI